VDWVVWNEGPRHERSGPEMGYLERC